MRGCAVLLLLATGACARTVSVELGPTNQEQGLAVPSAGDGANEPATLGGRACRQVAERAGYLYLQASDQTFPPGDYTVYLTCELFDDGPRVIQVQYDTVAAQPNIATCYQAGGAMVLLGSGRWVKRTIQLDHARFGNGQNHGSDLRLAGQCAVARVELSDTAPPGFTGNEPIPAAELGAIRTTIGPGMELTFGNDADPATAALYRALGVTSIESYVTWQTVEDAAQGQWDWSHWDAQVAVLEAAGLKWVPFLIAGPAYATPQWFREGPQHHPYVCLEHGQPSKVESLWSPALRPEIDRFLAAFAARYRDRGVIESVLLGITGIYGESIYPAGPEGGWTAGIPGPYHNHGGWWAGDRLAVADFQARLRRLYGTPARLNAAWGTAHASFADVTTFLPTKAPSAAAREDLVRWYEETMTEWSRWWVETTRRHFPRTAIYLCTGGDGAPFLGADFTAQAKAIAPYGAGIRITNEGSSYPANYAVTREVATATRLYGTFCGFEPASSVSPEGNVARVYNATASGARQLHCYTSNVVGSGAATQHFRRVAATLQRRTPVPPRVAVYLPRAGWAQDAGSVAEAYALVRSLREVVDLDLVNRTSVVDGVLKTAKALVLPATDHLEADAKAVIDTWVAAGGLLLREGREPFDLLVPEAVAPAPEKLVLRVGAAGDGPFLTGDWHGPEKGAEFPAPDATKRWTGPRPGLLLPVVTGRPLTLSLEILTPDHALAGATGRVLADGRELGRLQSGHAVYRFDLPARTTNVVRLQFEVSAWRPSEKQGTSDQRQLGVALSRVELTAAGATAEAQVNRGLRFRVDRAKLPVTRRGRGAEITLPRRVAASPEALGELLGPVAADLGAGDLRDDDAVDEVYATRLPGGRLWLNMTAQPVTRAGVTIEPYGIAETP